MNYESEEMFQDEEVETDLETNTEKLLHDLEEVGAFTGPRSPTIIPPTPQKHRPASNPSVFRRLAFAPQMSVERSNARPTGSMSIGKKQCVSIDCPSTSTPANSDILEILQEVRKTNTKLTEYEKRLEALEQHVSGIASTPTCSSSSSERVKTKVPPAVWVSMIASLVLCILIHQETSLQHLIRDVYKTLEESEDFVGFDLRYMSSCVYFVLYFTYLNVIL